ncbi:hypothetical protein [Kaarinaea lacus]
MTITAIIAISVFSTLATIALLLFVIKRFLYRRWKFYSRGTNHHRDLRHTYRWPGQSRPLNAALEWVESILRLDTEQLTLWNPLKQALIDSEHDLAAYREILNDAEDMEQSVNRWEDFIDDSLIELRKLKPKLIEFYHSLSVQQQQKVNAWFAGTTIGKRYCGNHCRMI